MHLDDYYESETQTLMCIMSLKSHRLLSLLGFQFFSKFQFVRSNFCRGASAIRDQKRS
jgi:hypothetical protein